MVPIYFKINSQAICKASLHRPSLGSGDKLWRQAVLPRSTIQKTTYLEIGMDPVVVECAQWCEFSFGFNEQSMGFSCRTFMEQVPYPSILIEMKCISTLSVGGRDDKICNLA